MLMEAVLYAAVAFAAIWCWYMWSKLLRRKDTEPTHHPESWEVPHFHVDRHPED